MGKTSTIEWTDSTYNPWTGCSKVSPGCQNCYAERITVRWGGNFGKLRVASEKKFYEPMTWGPLREPTWPGFPARRIFTCSMSDFFHRDADIWRDQAWEVIRRTPQHVYQILTKRPERVMDHLPITCWRCGHAPKPTKGGWRVDGYCDCLKAPLLWGTAAPWPNVWLGTSVELQMYLSERVGILASIPADMRFLSVEPLLGKIDFRRGDGYVADDPYQLHGIHWVIVGGESGPKARPMKADWVRLIRDQCADANVPFFFKQWGGNRKCDCHDAWGCCELDGQVHNAVPVPISMMQRLKV